MHENTRDLDEFNQDDCIALHCVQSYISYNHRTKELKRNRVHNTSSLDKPYQKCEDDYDGKESSLHYFTKKWI